MRVNYSFWAYGPTRSVYMIDRALHLLVCSLIDTSDEAHYGEGTWLNIGKARNGHRIAAVLNTEEEVRAVMS